MNKNLDDDPDQIWEKLNGRLHKKFGYAEEILKSSSIEDVNWANLVLPAYIKWDKMSSVSMILEFWH